MRKWRIIPLVLLVFLLLLGGYLLLDAVFPKAEPLSLPEAAEVVTITLTAHGTGQPVTLTDPAAQRELSALLAAARPTRRMSVNDTPDVGGYVTVDIETAAVQYRLFVYTEGGQTYVERPYEGILRADRALWSLLEQNLSSTEQNG